MKNNPQKIIAGRYQVVPRSIIFLIQHNQVLLQRAAESKRIFPGFYNGIGGHIESREDVLSGAKRELQEEAAISCDDLELAGTIMIDVEEDEGILLFVFTGSEINGDLLPSEEGTLHWVNIDLLETLQVVEDVPELVHKVVNFRKDRKLFFGKYEYDEEGNRITNWVTS